MLQRLWKPWFVHRPTQVGRRLYASLSPPPPGYRRLRTSWGVSLTADPSRTIGRNIVNTGLFDISVSEVLARLIVPGSTVIDGGANIGYMTLLAALAAGPTGRVIAFEPHPELSQILRANVAQAGVGRALAPIEVRQIALGDRPGVAELSIPDGFDGNDGIATLVQGRKDSTRSVTVEVDTLDSLLGDTVVEVMKLDVEDFEYQVLLGAAQALQARRIRHIVFEDHHARDSQVIRLFQASGYELFSVGWTVKGLALKSFESGDLAASYESPSFIATIDAAAVHARCSGGRSGWKVLQKGLGP